MSRDSETRTSAPRTALLAPLLADPARTAILTDVDGTLAPIAARPEQAAVPETARALLARLCERYGLVGCISGRQAAEAKRLVGLDRIAYAGNHGLELLLPGETEVRLDPSLAGRERAAAEFLAELDAEELTATGIRVEDKGPIQGLHWRGAEDERAAEAHAHELGAEAGRAGLEPRWGRKVLELRPVGGGGKDAAVAALLATDGVTAAIYAGDDRTDL
ncbi:MAG TPA: trehalose-phosphatase, partial [Solirubrobacterales bacterium]